MRVYSRNGLEPRVRQSLGNNTTTPLGSGATYTGTGERASDDGVSCSCITDNTGTLYFDFSNDGSNWAAFPSGGFSLASGVHEFHTGKVNGRYFRVRLVNDTGAQSYLRLYCYFGPHTSPNAPVNQTLSSDADASVVRVYNEDVELALGRLGGVTSRRKFGYASGLGVGIVIGTPSTWVDLWVYGGLRTVPPSSFTPYVASTASGDTDIEISYQYLDANGVEQQGTVNTNASNGQTPVSTGVTATELYRAWNSDSTAVTGNVSFARTNSFTSGAPTNQNEALCRIGPNDQQTQLMAFRVPSNKYCILKELECYLARESGAAGSAICAFEIRESGGVFRNIFPFTVGNSSPIEHSFGPTLLQPSTDVRMRIRDVSDNDTYITATLDYLFVDV